MQLTQSASMRMEQRQLLTPRMIQSMEILQLPLMALEERIEQELQNNPVLELREPEQEAATATENGEAADEARQPRHPRGRRSTHQLHRCRRLSAHAAGTDPARFEKATEARGPGRSPPADPDARAGGHRGARFVRMPSASASRASGRRGSRRR